MHVVKEGTTQLTSSAWVVIFSCFPYFEARKKTCRLLHVLQSCAAPYFTTAIKWFLDYLSLDEKLVVVRLGKLYSYLNLLMCYGACLCQLMQAWQVGPLKPRWIENPIYGQPLASETTEDHGLFWAVAASNADLASGEKLDSLIFHKIINGALEFSEDSLHLLQNKWWGRRGSFLFWFYLIRIALEGKRSLISDSRK